MKFRRYRWLPGFTLVEVLVVVGVIAALTSAGYYTATSVRESSRETKLESDVQSLNSSIQAYLASGGSLADLPENATVPQVLAKLKTRADAASVNRAIGLTGSFLDARVQAVNQSSDEASSSRLRAIWDKDMQRFVTARQGDSGVKEFVLNEALAAEAPVTEARVQTMASATESTWIWDYTNVNPIAAGTGPGGYSNPPGTAPVPGTIPPGSGTTEPPPPPTDPGEQTPSGALVAFSNLYGNAQFVGNLMIATPGNNQPMNNIYFYSETRIKGNLYLPGLPQLYVNWEGASQRWSTTNEALFAPYIEGQHYLENGTKVTPPQIPPTPRVLTYEPPGPTTPVYNVIFYGNSKIEGKVYRQYDKATLPTVAAPGTKTNNNTVSYSDWDYNPNNTNPAPKVLDSTQYANANLNTPQAIIPVKPGNYGTIAASSNSKLVLGDPNNPDVVQYYSFESLSLTGGADIEIVGKVVVTVKSSMAIHDGAVIGNPDHPDWLQLNFYSTNTPTQYNVPQQFHSTGTSQFYGRIVAPNGFVKFDGSSVFQGAVSAYKLEITSNSVIFVLPPVINN